MKAPFVKGEVVVLPFPFSDLSQSKRRPALVLAVLPGDDLIFCMITSQATREADAIALLSRDFAQGGLPRPSYLRPTRLFTGDGRLVTRSAGRVTATKLAQVVAAVVAIISR